MSEILTKEDLEKFGFVVTLTKSSGLRCASKTTPYGEVRLYEFPTRQELIDKVCADIADYIGNKTKEEIRRQLIP